MATNDFDPSQFGATAFDPATSGATPVAEKKGLLPRIGEFAHSVGDTLIPQTMKQYETAFSTFDKTKSPEERVKAYEDVKGGMTKSGLELAQYVPVTGATIPARAAIGAARGLASGLSQDNVTAGDTATRMVLASGGEALLPEITKKAGETLKPILKTVKDVVMNPLKGPAGQKVSNLAAEATEQGAKKSWDTLVTDFKTKVFEKLPNNKVTNDAVNKIISDFAPTPGTTVSPSGIKMIDEASLNPEELLKLRSQIQNQYGPNLFKMMSGTNNQTESKVASVMRNLTSKSLHELVPETISPDNALRIYHQVSRVPVVGPIMSQFGLPGLVAAGFMTKGLTGKLSNLIQVASKVIGGTGQ